jgi:pimeloyl-ACP methyl ester carboxylesterase
MEVAAKAPALRLWLREGLEIPALLASPLLPAVAIPSGNGQPVMVLPGYLTGDLSSVRLRRSLAAAGYSALGWGLGQNRGARTDLLERLVRRIDTVVARHGEQLSLIGWSLGGVFAREAAKLRPRCGEPRDHAGKSVFGQPARQQCLAALRAAQRPPGRPTAAGGKSRRKAAGHDDRDVVSARRYRSAAVRTRA